MYEAPEALQNYGLDGPPRIEFTTAHGEVHALRIGDAAPTGDGRYLSDGHARRVFLTPESRAAAFTRSFFDLRDARVLDFEIPAVRGFRARWPGGAVEIARVPEGWRLVRPVAAPANAARIEALLERLRYLRAEDFLDPPVAGIALDEKKLGLAPPHFAIELDLEGSENPHRLALGALEKTARGSSRFVARGPGGQHYFVAANLQDALPRTTFAYREQKLSRFLPENIEVIELRYPVSGYPNDPRGKPLRLRLVREENEAGEKTWRVFFLPLVANGHGFIPNFNFYSELAATVLAEFSVLDASDVLAETGTARARFGLAPPRASVRFFESRAPGTAPVTALSFGEPLADGRGLPVRRSDGGPIFLVPPELAESIPLDAQSFRSELGWSTSEPRAREF